MRRNLLTLILAQTVTMASAQSGPTTLAMSCNQVRRMVASQGAVVLHTGPTTYDRFVRDSSFCLRPNVAQVTWVRTADAAQCPVSVCRETTIDQPN